jgi:hypothetical protein
MDDAVPPVEEAAPLEEAPSNGWRFYVGGGGAKVGEGRGDVGSLGFDRITDGELVRATLGGSILLVSGANEETRYPLWGGDLALRFRTGKKLVLYASGGVGCHFAIVLPMPSVRGAVGLEIPLGRGSGPSIDLQVGFRETFAWTLGFVPIATGELGIVTF